MFHKLLLTILLTSAICYGQYDTIITIHRDTVNNVNKYDTLIYPQLSPVSGPSFQFTHSRRDTNNEFNQTMWYDEGRNALWFKKNMTKKYNLLTYDSLFNYLNSKSAYGYLGEGTDNYIAKFATSTQSATIPVMTNNNSPSGQASSSTGPAFQAFNETILSYAETSYNGSPTQTYADFNEVTWNDADSLNSWIMYKFSTPKSISKYIMGAGWWSNNGTAYSCSGGSTAYKYYLTAYPTSWTFYGSNDSTTWVVLDSTSYSAWGSTDTTGFFINCGCKYSMTPAIRNSFTNKTNISSFSYYKIKFKSFYTNPALTYGYIYKIRTGAIQLYEGSSVNFADSKIRQSSAADSITIDAITKTNYRAEIGGTLIANGMITSLSDGTTLYENHTGYTKYTKIQPYAQEYNIDYRLPTSYPSSNQYLKAISITGSNPVIVNLGWGTDQLGTGGSGGGNVYNSSDSTANYLTKWVGGNRYITSSKFYDGTYPMWWNGSSFDTLATRAWHRANDLLGSVGSGEANTYSTTGGYMQWTKTKVGVDLPFKGVTAGSGISITDNSTYLTIAATGGTGVSGREIKSAVLPLYKTNDTTITLKGLTSLGTAGQIPKMNSGGTALEWASDLQTAGGSGGQVFKVADTTSGYLTKWYDGHTIRGSLFYETSSSPFWNGDSLIRSTYYRFHDRNHNIISADHNDGSYGAYVGKVLKVGSGGYLTWGTDSIGAGGGSGDLTGTGITSTYVKNYSNWTGTKTLGYIGAGMGLRDSATSGGAHFSLVPSLIAQGAYPKYYGDSLLTPNYYKLHQHWGTSGKLTKWGASNVLEDADIDYTKVGTAVTLYKSSGTLSISCYDYYLRHATYGDTWRTHSDNYDMVFGALVGATWAEKIRFKNDGKISGTGADGTVGNFITKVDSGSNPGYASKWYVDSCVNARIAFITETHVYGTVEICGVTWQATNLNTTYYRNGDPIPRVTDPTAWANLTTGAYCDYDNDANNSAGYGRLYNWYAVTDARGLAPTGWHVATDAEWSALTTCVGGEAIAGGKLKEVGIAHWDSPNTNASDEFHFTALPGGFRYTNGTFYDMTATGIWWTSTTNFRRSMFYNQGYVDRYSDNSVYGYSVRCVKD
jgi:uncharacterized protein (TIGR02145 family)